MSGGSSRRYPPELRERAVRMVASAHESLVAAREQLSSLKGSAYAVVRNTAVIGGRSPARRPRCR
jgi:transposase-like protein